MTKTYGTLRQREQLAKNIDSAISRTGKSLHQVSKETGISVSTLYDWARGNTEPGAIGLAKFAEGINIDVEQLTKGI